MPDEPTPTSRAREDEDVYVVDTRKQRRRSSPAPAAAAPPRPRGPQPRPSPQPGSRAAAAPDQKDEGYVVDTREQGRRGSTSDPTASPSGPRTKRTRLRKGRLALLVGALLVISWIVFLIWVPVAAWNRVERVDNAPGTRPDNTSGYNYLLVGSDNREGLTPEQRRALGTGSAEGKRTDTIMLVHVSESGGKPAIVSIPRDSYVPIPGNGSNKINASFAIGGAKLLTETVEQATGIYIDGYVEIGFAGFAGMVDGLGGVYLCVPRDMLDPKAHIDLKKGCQVLTGPDALGYVRSRYEDPLGDIGRANRQRQFLGAVMKQAATPSTVLLPWRYKSVADAVSRGLVVGNDTSLRDAIRVLQAMRAVSNDQGLSLGVPTSDLAYQTANAGVAVKWDTEKALALFTAIKNDEPLTAAPAGTTTKEPGQ